MGKRTGEPNPYKKKLFSLCVTERYLWLDLSLLFNVEPGVGEVATYRQDGALVCLFNWHFEDGPSYPHFDKIVTVPYGEWWSELFREGREYNRRYREWVES